MSGRDDPHSTGEPDGHLGNRHSRLRSIDHLSGTFTPLRPPPERQQRDDHTEQVFFAAVMIDNGVYPKVVATGLRRDHFGSEAHRSIWDAISTLIERGELADPVTLRPYVEHDPGLSALGGAGYLARLAIGFRDAGAYEARHAPAYADFVRKAARGRSAVAAAWDYLIALDGPRPAIDPDEHIARLRGLLEEIEAPQRQPLSRDEVLAKVSCKSWIDRDIAPLDRLLGDMLTTTTRMMLVAPTGLGKTNIALAMAVAVALGRDYLHWRGAGRPRRVLYVDGEMSQRLMKQRIIDAARRAGLGELRETDLATLQAHLFVVNHADFDLQPLNTAAGQQFIDQLIELVGGVDLAVFDNIQALTVGDPLDPNEWQQVLPWTKQLTNRQIGQLWIHHTGHDEGHAYGPKTREWQFDSVALLERVERPEADIAFKIHFKIKARERTPDNRTDFDEAFVTLADDAWSSERGDQFHTLPVADRVFELLQDEIVRHGTTLPPEYISYAPSNNTPCVKEALLRKRCEMGCISDGDPDPAKKAEADRKAFKRATQRLLDRGLIGKHGEWFWIVR